MNANWKRWLNTTVSPLALALGIPPMTRDEHYRACLFAGMEMGLVVLDKNPSTRKTVPRTTTAHERADMQMRK